MSAAIKVHEGYVIGLLTELEAEVPRLVSELTSARQRAGAVDAELASLLERAEACKRVLADAQTQASRSSLSVAEGNHRIAIVHQELAMSRKRSDDLKTEMDRMEPGMLHRKLRRERAKLAVLQEDKEAEIEAVRSQVAEQHGLLEQAEKDLVTERDRSRIVTRELDTLQGQLPDPHLYSSIFEKSAARAHCRFHLDRKPAEWVAEMGEAMAWTEMLHRELRAGKYRIDHNSELIGGRAMASSEAMYAAVAVGDRTRASKLFDLIVDPSLFFHQIFNVFRVWCLGLYLSGETTQLRELLRLHQYAPGLRGAYVQAYIGVLTRDRRRLAIALKDLSRHEWELRQEPQQVRGSGIVSLGALAFCALASEAGIPIPAASDTMPAELLKHATRRRR